MAAKTKLERIQGVEIESPLDDLLSRPVNQKTSFDVMLDDKHFDQLMKTAEVLSKADCVPFHFKGKVPDIFMVLCRAYSWGIDPMIALEQCFVTQGRIGVSSQLAIALANRSGLLKTPIFWENTDATSATAVAHFRNGKVERATVDMDMANKEGWTKRKKTRDGRDIPSKYETMPENMLMWRSAKWLINRHLPEVALGMLTREELEDIEVAEISPQLDSAASVVATLPSEPSPEPQTVDVVNLKSLVVSSASIQELESLLPELKKLPDADKAEVRAVYRARMVELTKPPPDKRPEAEPIEIPEHLADWVTDLRDQVKEHGRDAALAVLKGVDELSAEDKATLAGLI